MAQNEPFNNTAASTPPSAIFVDFQEVKLQGHVTKATYGPTDDSQFAAKDVTNEVKDLIRAGRTQITGGIHTAIGDPFPGHPKAFKVWYGETTNQRALKEKFEASKKPKSLYIAIVVTNPFERARSDEPPHIPDPSKIGGYDATKFNPATFLRDDDFLKEGPNAPNDFQKLIELLLRLKRRGLQVYPENVLHQLKPGQTAPPDQPWNYFRGYMLVESAMYISPDKDEAYFKVHADRATLVAFAERQSLTLRTNPYSFGGGAGMIYNASLAEELKESVGDFLNHYEIPEDDSYCRGKLDKKTGKYSGWGFCVEVPQKMRLLLRIMREGWIFGGCGLQLDEMKEDGILIRNYFPLHNKAYQESYGIDNWGSWSAFCDCANMLADNEYALVHYFGESISIYFSWMRRYCQWLFFPALIGVPAGVLQEVGIYREVVGAVFAALMVIWAVFYLRSWERAQKRFAVKWGQNVEAEDELVRDEFEYSHKKRVDVHNIFTLSFEYPLTMQRLPDGTMVELVFPLSTRLGRRYFVSYPLLVLVTGSMVAGLYFVEVFRFKNLDNFWMAVIASVVSVLISAAYGKIFPGLVELLNEYENARTETEYEEEMATKSFFFYFVSTYFSVFVIGLWRDDSLDRETRIRQLKTQMIIQQAVMPLINNIIEIVVPKITNSLQKRVDALGGHCAAICSYFCCCGCCPACAFDETVLPEPTTVEEMAARQIWEENALAPYESTSNDYLEVVIGYGYLLMFAAVFPWAGVAGLVYNIIEIRVDAMKLVTIHQRPLARIAKSIGPWTTILWALTGLAVITNSYYIVYIAHTVKEIGLIDAGINPHEGDYKRVLYFLVLQYAALFAIIVLSNSRGDTSLSVKQNEVKQQLLRDRAIQSYVKKSLTLSSDELKKRDSEPLDTGDGSAGAGGEERHKMAEPCTEFNRWIVFFFLLATIGLGTASILMPSWYEVTGGATPSKEYGLVKACQNSVCSTYTNEVCASGLDTSDRRIVMLAMACGGCGFAFVSVVLVFCVIKGNFVILFRCALAFLSLSCWITLIVMWQQNYMSCSGTAPVGSSFGIAFWLAIGAGGSALLAFSITLGRIIYVRCCPNDEDAAEIRRNTRAGPRNKLMKKPVPKKGDRKSASASDDAVVDGQKKKTDDSSSSSSRKQTEEERKKEEEQQKLEEEKKQQKLKEALEMARKAAEQEAARAAAAGEEYVTVGEGGEEVAGGHINADAAAAIAEGDAAAAVVSPNNPATADDQLPNAAEIGLDPEEWVFDPSSGFFWSEKQQMYYDAESQCYGCDGKWLDPVTGEWM